jgi:hypothetical protein
MDTTTIGGRYDGAQNISPRLAFTMERLIAGEYRLTIPGDARYGHMTHHVLRRR